jgi:hypothetical protein
MSSASRPVAIALIGFLTVAAFAFLLKLMYDMSQSMGHMTRDIAAMAADVHGMGRDLGALSEQVAGIRAEVGQMSADMRGMRQSVDRMSTVIQAGGKQIEQVNPMGVMQQMLPPGTGR